MSQWSFFSACKWWWTCGLCRWYHTRLLWKGQNRAHSKLMIVPKETYLWKDSNGLVINDDKSCILFFCQVGSVHLDVCGIEMSRGLMRWPEKRFEKYLGVLLDENLSFLHHIQAVELKISRNIGIIKKPKTFSRRKHCSCYAMLLSNTIYNTVQWSGNQLLNLTCRSSIRFINNLWD